MGRVIYPVYTDVSNTEHTSAEPSSADHQPLVSANAYVIVGTYFQLFRMF